MVEVIRDTKNAIITLCTKVFTKMTRSLHELIFRRTCRSRQQAANTFDFIQWIIKLIVPQVSMMYEVMSIAHSYS